MKNIREIDLTNKNIYQHKVWGNSAEIARTAGLPENYFGEDVVGEVFLASTHRDGKSIFKDGKSFDEVIASEPEVFGAAVSPKKVFPILLKVLSANQPLSVQTHYKNKVEAWLTLSDGEILYGLTEKGAACVRTETEREAFFEILKNSNDKEELAQYFNLVKFKKNESFVIQAGVVHALLGGTLFEPQKNSNLTLRAGDWGRNLSNRPLHKEDFFESLYPYAINPAPITRLYKMKNEHASHSCRFALQDFALDEIIVDGGSRTIETFDDRFFIVIVMDGDVTILNEGEEQVYSQGQAFVLKAVPSQWTFSGHGRVLLTYVPHLQKGIIEPLFDMDYSYDEIISLGGPILKENDLYIHMKEEGIL